MARPRLDEQILVGLMGETGAGKSDFARRVTGSIANVSHSLTPSRLIATHGFHLPTEDGSAPWNVTLIDCPGFDDGSMPDRQIIESILEYLRTNFQENQKLHGIIYMIPINRTRITNQHLADFAIFRELCGLHYYQNVVLATTHWDMIENEANGRDKERQLQNTPKFWGEMAARGSKVRRITSTHRDYRASDGDLSILREIARNSPRWLQAQTQMGEDGVPASETSAMVEYDHWRQRILSGQEPQQQTQRRATRQVDDNRLEEIREHNQRLLERYEQDWHDEQARLQSRMDGHLEQESNQVHDFRKQIQNRGRDFRQREREVRRQARARSRERSDDARRSAEVIQRLNAEKEQKEVDLKESEERERRKVRETCQRFVNGDNGVRDLVCNALGCLNRIDGERDEYFHCCYCKHDRYYHCRHCGNSCGKKHHPTMLPIGPTVPPPH